MRFSFMDVLQAQLDDCMRFSFMDVLQAQLDEVQLLWNTHLIRHSQSPRVVTGVPDELFYFPEIQGFASYIIPVCVSFTPCMITIF